MSINFESLSLSLSLCRPTLLLLLPYVCVCECAYTDGEASKKRDIVRLYCHSFSVQYAFYCPRQIFSFSLISGALAFMAIESIIKRKSIRIHLIVIDVEFQACFTIITSCNDGSFHELNEMKSAAVVAVVLKSCGTTANFEKVSCSKGEREGEKVVCGNNSRCSLARLKEEGDLMVLQFHYCYF
jgi:hypothetical protein